MITARQDIRVSLYRPFCKQYLCYGRDLNERIYQMPAFMPQQNLPNLLIGVVGKGGKRFEPIITDVTPALDVIKSAQWFAMYSYTPNFNCNTKWQRQDNITDSALANFIKTYNNNTITKEDIFYYIYGLLNCKDYQSEFFDFIIKEIPRIPMVENFTEFSAIGKKLADLHINYENIAPLDTITIKHDGNLQDADYYVDKIKFKSKLDKTSIIYNSHITIEDIPLKAYEYIVSGKSPIEWIIDRYQIRTHKESGIVNNPNSYKGGKYIFDLLLSVMSLSIKSIDLINKLPKMQVIK